MPANKGEEKVGEIQGRLQDPNAPEGAVINYRMTVTRNSSNESSGETVVEHIMRKIEESDS
tara:strand:+ start:720 stop:902 length:183 start_codon:yes stop_codon:yes gene_type:complete